MPQRSPRPRSSLQVRLLLAAALSASVFVAVPAATRTSAAGPDVTVNAAARHQVIDGWGVNANPKNWGNAAYPPLQPGIDLLVDDLGANIWRVDVYGKSNWEATNDDADPFTFNWTYYNQLYETAPFQSLWSTLAELNAKGIAPIISASGVVPDWMGGSSINNDDEFVETFVSLVYYARMVKHVQFNLVDPLNETDHGSPEGPNVSASHMATILSKMRARLASPAIGLSDLRFVAPETATPSTIYNGALLTDSTVAPYVQVFAGHQYSQFDLSAEAQQMQSAGNTTARLWMTEYSTSIFGFLDNGETVPDEWAFTQAMATNLFSFVKTGAQAALVWDGYDNVHDHAGNYTRWGLLDTLNNYARKKRYYGARQVFAYVKPGSVRVDVTTSIGNLDLMAFVNDATGDVTIVGQNSSASAKTLTIGVQGVAAPAALSLTQTTPSLDNAPGGTISQSGGTYTVAVAANSIFTLTSAGAPAGTPTPGATATGSPQPTATPWGGPKPVGGIASALPTPAASQVVAEQDARDWRPYLIALAVACIALSAFLALRGRTNK